VEEVVMDGRSDDRDKRTPRRASSIQPWVAPERILDWIAARVGHG
jgi:hypothetical protein